MKLWKVFKKGLKSNNGNIKWVIGEWQKYEGELQICNSGFHASKRIIDAMQYTNAEEIALVEVKGKSIKEKNKECWEYMRVLKVYTWSKEDSVELAIFAAELVLPNFEKQYPDDFRPRQAIEAAKTWLKEKNRSAAASAAWSAAWSAWSAAESAESVARSAAERAAWSAWSAARSAAERAAESAESAAWSAARSAESAARSARSADKILNKCEKFILKRLGL